MKVIKGLKMEPDKLCQVTNVDEVNIKMIHKEGCVFFEGDTKSMQ